MCKMLKQYSDKIKDSAASRRLAHIQKRSEIAAKSYQDWGGYFCVLLISLPRAYPTAKSDVLQALIGLAASLLCIRDFRGVGKSAKQKNL